MRAHLHKFFTRAVEHHLAKAKHHTSMAAHFRKLTKGKSDMEHSAEVYADVADAHSEVAGEHVSMGEHCAECAKVFSATGKAMGLTDFDRELLLPLPEGISTIAPDAPSNLRLIPRAGQQPIDTSKVAAGLEKIVGGDGPQNPSA